MNERYVEVLKIAEGTLYAVGYEEGQWAAGRDACITTRGVTE